jgi:protein-S-isoprenylcysteine O-methyltransferase
MSVSPTAAFEERVRYRAQAHPLETKPINHIPHGNIPNTPLATSIISFLLGALFSLGMMVFCAGGLDRYWWTTYQLGFFVAAWSGFHWAEFAVTAGWNLEKCSVDCNHHFILICRARFHLRDSVSFGQRRHVSRCEWPCGP